jgi:outer membrane protein OmpA-like peptidoglycan-associated protein
MKEIRIDPQRIANGSITVQLQTGEHYRIVVPSKTAKFSARVVDEQGEPLADVPLLFRHAGKDVPAKTDTTGVATCTVAGIDNTNVTFASAADLAILMKPKWTPSKGVARKNWVKADDTTTVVTLFGGDVVKVIADDATTGTTRPKETLEPFFGVPATPVKSGETPTKIATLTVQPLVIMVRMLGEHFDVDKCFLLPKALDSVRDLVRLHKEYKLTDLLIVGHTDTSASDEHNLILSLERTSAMHAYLINDAKSWLPWYDADKQASKRWGTTEDSHMIESVMGKPSTVLEYQRWHNAQDPQKDGCETIEKVDGKIGPDTRLQLILDYMNREDTTVPDGTTIQVHGCGEFFTLDKTEEALDPHSPDNKREQRNRRVEVFLFPKEVGILPPVPGETAEKGEKEYPEWRLRSVDYDLLAVNDSLARWIGWGPQGGDIQTNLVLADLAGKELLSVTPTVYSVPNFDGICQRFDLASPPTTTSFRLSTVSNDNPAHPPVVFDMMKIVASLLHSQGLGEAVSIESLDPTKRA